MERLLFLDAKTRFNNYRITAFSDRLEDLMHNYQDWIRENEFKAKDMWYANVFEVGTNKHKGYMRIGEDEEITFTAVEHSKLSPYRRSLKQIIEWFTGIR